MCYSATLTLYFSWLGINRENMPSHFKFKEYCPLVFRNLRERFGIDDQDFLVRKLLLGNWTCATFMLFCLPSALPPSPCRLSWQNSEVTDRVSVQCSCPSHMFTLKSSWLHGLGSWGVLIHRPVKRNTTLFQTSNLPSYSNQSFKAGLVGIRLLSERPNSPSKIKTLLKKGLAPETLFQMLHKRTVTDPFLCPQSPR